MNPQISFLLNKALESLRHSNLESAELYLKQAIRLQANNPHVLRLLGVISAQRKRYPEALEYLTASLKLLPKNSLTLSNMGNIFLELREHKKALESYDKSIQLDSKYEEVWSNKGNILYELKRYEEAIVHHDKALALRPDYAEAWSNKGNVLTELKRYEEAILHHDKALSLRPDYAKAWSNKGNVLTELKRYEEAIAHYDKALFLESDYAEAWSNKGNVLTELKRYEEAIAHYDKALILKPDIDWIFGDSIHIKMKVCAWQNLQDERKRITSGLHSNHKIIRPFSLISLMDDGFLHKVASEIYAQDKYPLNPILGPIQKRLRKEKIRIGYFSPDFTGHPVAYLTAELFEIHNRNQFEVFAFSLQGSAEDDEMRLRLINGFDRFLDVENLSDLQISALARELEIDIAIDLSGLTKNSRAGIFASRAAPIQVNWLGYPGTIGAEFFDYIVADETVIPEADRQFFTEKIAYLPHTYMVDDSKRIPSSRIFSRKECGLPEKAFVFCCFNNDFKFNEQVLECWSRIMLKVDGSVLWLSENNEEFMVNIKSEFEKRGIDPSRIIYAERIKLMEDHLSRYSLANLFLDTHPYNAHTTSVDALKTGVPVITLMGESFASRVAASLLSAVGLPELISSSQDKYEELAIDLATQPSKLDSIKKILLENLTNAPLFNTQQFARSLESAYIQMMERYWAGLEPDHIYIKSTVN